MTRRLYNAFAHARTHPHAHDAIKGSRRRPGERQLRKRYFGAVDCQTTRRKEPSGRGRARQSRAPVLGPLPRTRRASPTTTVFVYTQTRSRPEGTAGKRTYYPPRVHPDDRTNYNRTAEIVFRTLDSEKSDNYGAVSRRYPV